LHGFVAIVEAHIKRGSKRATGFVSELLEAEAAQLPGNALMFQRGSRAHQRNFAFDQLNGVIELPGQVIGIAISGI